MKVLVYFSGKLFEPKGTPIRTRNILHALVENGVDVYYAGQDDVPELPNDHVLHLTRPFGRIFQLVRYVNRHHINLFYMQTTAGIWYAPFIALLTKARVGIDFHDRINQEVGMQRGYSTFEMVLRETIESLMCKWFVYFATGVSYTLQDYYKPVIRHFWVLPVGTDVDLFKPGITPNSEVMEWKKGTILLGYAGNLKWYQGMGTVLDAFSEVSKRYPDEFSLFVIGSSDTADVEKYVKEHNLEKRVKLMGKQPHDAIPSLLSAADILTIIRPSDMTTEFSFPSKFAEYAALGKTLIVSRISDMPRYVEDGVNGIIVAPENVAEAVAGLERLRDPELRATLGKNIRTLAVEEFNMETLGTRLCGFLRTLVA